MPNSACSMSAYSCVAWHIRSKLDDRDERQLGCVIWLLRQAERQIFAPGSPMLASGGGAQIGYSAAIGPPVGATRVCGVTALSVAEVLSE
jgi:hypothetical protein